LHRMIPRSMPLLEEMQRIVNDGGSIGAEGRAKDDRVMAAALAYQSWNTWVMPRVKAIGLTLDVATKRDNEGDPPPTERIITNYLKRMQITVPT
jgi:hypothetical protein